jgi:hypothetical protein
MMAETGKWWPRVLAAFAGVLACATVASPAQAQRARVFVASYGSDSNPCTFGSPCKTFQHAHDAVAAGGEITAIDSAGFGPLIISKAVTITSPAGVEAGVTASAGGTAITINAATNDVVTLRGLTLIGGGDSAYYGVVVNSVGRIDVVDCTVRDFLFGGIRFTLSSAAHIVISNSKFLNNFGTGIDLVSVQGTGISRVTLDRIVALDNGDGIIVGPHYTVWLTNSSVTNNGEGIVMAAGTSTSSNAILFIANVTSVNIQNDLFQSAYSVVFASYFNGFFTTDDGNTTDVLNSDGNNLMTFNVHGAKGTWGAN